MSKDPATASHPAVTTIVRDFNEETIAIAAGLIARGQVVAIPTETVYGLAADAGNPSAVAAIYQAKGRPDFNPLIVHVLDVQVARRLVSFSDAAERLASTFWPGPLTMVLPRLPGSPVASLASAGLATLAVRSPAHPAIRALLAASGKPLAAPSANASGGLSPTRAEHVARSLDGRVPLVVDGGAATLGLESTIVAVEHDRLRLLRPGPISVEALAAAAGLPVVMAGGGTIEAPGQMASHYAPSKPLRLNAVAAQDNEWLIGFGAVGGDENLSASGDLVEAAARLFDALHRADAGTALCIAVAPIPEQELGIAINDRLRRAAAPR